MAIITNTIKLYYEDGIQAITTLNRNINSNNARRKFDGRAEARIIEIACIACASKNIDSILNGPLPHSISETRALDISAFSASSLCVRFKARR